MPESGQDVGKLLEQARQLATFIRERWNPENKMPPLGIAGSLEELAQAYDELRAGFTAAGSPKEKRPRFSRAQRWLQPTEGIGTWRLRITSEATVSPIAARRGVSR